MARKRLNVKFIVLGLGPVFLLAGGLIAWKVVPKVFPKVRWLVHGPPEQYATKGKALFDEGKYKDAVEAYEYALFLKSQADAPLYTALADCYSHLILSDDESAGKSVQYYEAALGTDPSYLPAMERLLDWRVDQAELIGGPRGVQAWDQVSAIAQKVLAVQPNHRKAKVAAQRAILSKWRLGTETPPQQIDDAMAALTELAQQDPYDGEDLFYVVQAMMTRVQARLNSADRDGATALTTNVLKVLTENLTAHPNDPVLHYRAAMIYRAVGLAERATGQPPKYMDESLAQLKLAAELVKPDHEMYTEIKLLNAKQLESKPETAPVAEQTYRAMLAERPTELQVRIALAELLSRNPNTQDQAITLLEQAPPADLTRNFGMKAFIAKSYQRVALFDLINIKLDTLARLRGQPGYDAVVQQIEQAFGKLTSIPGVSDSAMALQTRGRIELAKGQNFQAVQTLERAMKMIPTVSEGPDADSRYRLMFFLAGAYMLTGQNGEAKTLLSSVVAEVPQLPNARLMLAQLLLDENRNDEAKPHIDKLTQMMPGDARVVRMQMRILDKTKDKDKLWALYQSLPQETGDQVIAKAQAAVYIDRRDEAIKLMETLRTANPSDANVCVTLARLYSDLGDKARALELADAALKIVPDNPQIKLLRADIANADVAGLRRELIDAVTDPLTKAVLQYELAVQEDRSDDAEKYLQTAVSINPEDGRVVELVFNRAMIRRDWDTAQTAADKLAKQNRDGVNGVLYRVRLALARGDLDQAADLANQLVKSMGEFAPSWVVLGQVQKAQKKYVDAMQSFETALARRPKELTALRELIDLSYITGSPARAKEYISQGRRVFPDYLPFREVELAHELKYGDPEKVIAPRQEMLQAAIDKKDPNEMRAWVALGNAYLAVARSKDNPQASRPFLEKARDTFKQAMDKFPDAMQPVDLYAESQLQLRTPAEGERAIMALRDREAWKAKPEPTILLSNYYGRSGKTAEQEQVLRDYLAASPATVPVELELSFLLSKQNKLDDALKLLEINAEQPEIRRQRIELQIAGGRISDAEKEIKTAIDASPNPSSMLLNRQAFVYMKSNRDSDALDVIQKSLAKSPNDMEALFLQASLNLKYQRNLPQAIRNLEAARDNKFKELDARMMLAEAYRYSRDDEAAVRELEESVRLFPEDKRARLRLLDFYSDPKSPNWVQAERTLREARNLPKLADDPDVISAEARMWLQRKQADRAGRLLADALQKYPANMDLLRLYCQSLFDARDYQNLIRSTEAMVQSKKAPWWMYQLRGKAHKQMDDRQTALADFQAGMDVAWAANDDNAATVILGSIAEDIGVAAARARISQLADKKDGYRWQLMMSYLFMLENDFDSAITWAEKVANDADVTPDYRDNARRQLGSLYLRATPPQVGKAVAAYRQLIQGTPNDVISLNNLASAMILPNSGYGPNEALEFSKRAFDIIAATGQPNAYIYDTQGYVLVLAGRVQEGITILKQALDAEPLPDSCLHLGEAYLQLSSPRVGDAQEVLKQGLALVDAWTRDNKPVDPEVKSKLEKMLERADQLAARASR